MKAGLYCLWNLEPEATKTPSISYSNADSKRLDGTMKVLRSGRPSDPQHYKTLGGGGGGGAGSIMHNFCGWVSGQIKKYLDVQGLGFEHKTTENVKSDAVKKPSVFPSDRLFEQAKQSNSKGVIPADPLILKILNAVAPFPHALVLVGRSRVSYRPKPYTSSALKPHMAACLFLGTLY